MSVAFKQIKSETTVVVSDQGRERGYAPLANAGAKCPSMLITSPSMLNQTTVIARANSTREQRGCALPIRHTGSLHAWSQLQPRSERNSQTTRLPG